MKLSELNGYLQTLATIGAIAGLLLLTYEIRQSNNHATQQARVEYWSGVTQMFTAQLGTGITEILAKSYTEPENLTLAEKIELDSYYWGIISQATIVVLGYEYTSPELAEYALADFAKAAPSYFGGRIGRGWFAQGKAYMNPKLADAIERELAAIPIDDGLEYYEGLNAYLETQ